jgi:hypothetical protein
VRARCEPLTLPHPACEVGVLKRHGVGEGESEVEADFFVVAKPGSTGGWVF